MATKSDTTSGGWASTVFTTISRQTTPPSPHLQQKARHEPEGVFYPAAPSPNWQLFDKKLRRLYNSNEFIRACSWSGPARELYMPNLAPTPELSDFVTSTNKSPEQEYCASTHAEQGSSDARTPDEDCSASTHAEQGSSEAKTLDEDSQEQTSLETSSDIETDWADLRARLDKLMLEHGVQDIITPYELDNTCIAAAGELHAFKLNPHSVDSCVNVIQSRDKPNPQQPLNETLPTKKASDQSLTDMAEELQAKLQVILDKDASDDEGCDDDDEASWEEIVPEDGEDAEALVPPTQIQGLRAAASTSGDEIEQDDCSKEQTEELLLLKSNCRLLADLLEDGFEPGQQLLETTERLCASIISSRRSSAVPFLTSDHGSIATSSSNVVSSRPHTTPYHDQLDFEGSDGNVNFSFIKGDNDFIVVVKSLPPSDNKQLVQFDVEAMLTPEDGPEPRLRDSKDCAAKNHGILKKKSTIQEIGTIMKRLAKPQHTAGVEEADTDSQEPGYDADESENWADNKDEDESKEETELWRQRCHQLNRTPQPSPGRHAKLAAVLRKVSLLRRGKLSAKVSDL